jgi:hypothetical protein
MAGRSLFLRGGDHGKSHSPQTGASRADGDERGGHEGAVRIRGPGCLPVSRAAPRGAVELGGDDKDAKTEVGRQSRDGQARIFLAAWDNDNEWYPVKDIEWILDDDSATLLIFGVTAKQRETLAAPRQRRLAIHGKPVGRVESTSASSNPNSRVRH